MQSISTYIWTKVCLDTQARGCVKTFVSTFNWSVMLSFTKMCSSDVVKIEVFLLRRYFH